MVTVLTQPSTVDAISGDDANTSESLESSIEGSIKRCEALLSMLPTTLGKSFDSNVLHETSNEKLRKARAYLNMNMNMKNLMEGLEPEWNKNMGLLSNISMSRDVSSSPASESWCSYSLNNKTSTQSSPPGNDEQPPQVFMCKTSVTRSKDVGHTRFGGETWRKSMSSADEEGNQSLDPSEDVSNRASSESGESAESTVTDLSPKAASQSSFTVTSIKGTLSQPDAAMSVLPSKGFEEGSLEVESPSHEIKVSKLGEAGSVAKGDTAPKPSLLEKPSSCSSSPASEPALMEPQKLTPLGHTNAAGLKPTGLPTNYKKTNAPSQKEWSSSLKLQEGKSKHKGKVMRQERLKMHTLATVARLSVPKMLASQRVCHMKATPLKLKRNETPLKLGEVMHLSTPKDMAMRKCEAHRNTTPERSKLKGQKDFAPKCWAPFVERLGDIQKRINSSKRAKKIRDKEERDLCSFQPNINCKYLDVASYQPIEKRLDCIREQKDKMIKTARDQEAKDLGITFRPELNPNSARILKERAAFMKSPALTLDINDESRSANPRSYSNNYLADIPEPWPKAGDFSRSVSECTFVPEINANTEQILAGTPLEGCDFLTRQQQFLHRIEQRKRMKQQELASDFTFQPERGNSEFILSCSPLFKINENLAEMCERLSRSDHHRRFCIQQQISNNYYSQFAFHPHVDETSRLIGRNPSIETLYADERAKHHKDLLRRLAHEEFQRTCTFRPMVKVPIYPVEEAALEERKRLKLERKKQEDRERISKELEELAECTFKPVINPWPPKEPDCGLQIKGVQRHLELQRLAKQMKLDQAEWEKKVFFSHQTNERPRQQYTIPKPFNFHTGSCNGHCSGPPVNRRNRMLTSTPVDPHLCT